MDFLEKQCPVCSQKFQKDDDIVVCPKCGAPYHRECYDKNGKCIFPDLHKSKQSWHEVYDKSEDTPAEQDDENAFVVCRHCGEKNPKNAFICHKCGSLILQQPDPDETDNENDDDEIPNFIGNNSNPFMFIIDPMGGVAKNEDFNGVTGAEMARVVRANTPYYMPIFKKLKDKNTGKFNFAAFFLTGGWYLYRKQYVMGAIISALYFSLSILEYMVTIWFSNDLWKEALSAVSSSGISHPDYNDVISWAFSNNSSNELLLMMLPYILRTLTFILQLVCGFVANRSYYHHCIQKISAIKKSNSSENINAEISEKGGVNTPLAWSMMICYLITIFAFSLL